MLRDDKNKCTQMVGGVAQTTLSIYFFEKSPQSAQKFPTEALQEKGYFFTETLK